jgi:hypothetical protein
MCCCVGTVAMRGFLSHACPVWPSIPSFTRSNVLLLIHTRRGGRVGVWSAFDWSDVFGVVRTPDSSTHPATFFAFASIFAHRFFAAARRLCSSSVRHGATDLRIPADSLSLRMRLDVAANVLNEVRYLYFRVRHVHNVPILFV